GHDVRRLRLDGQRDELGRTDARQHGFPDRAGGGRRVDRLGGRRRQRRQRRGVPHHQRRGGLGGRAAGGDEDRCTAPSTTAPSATGRAGNDQRRAPRGR